MPSPLSRIDFGQFLVKNPNSRGAFEDLCYHLFYREFGAASGVRADFNEAGLETKHLLYKGLSMNAKRLEFPHKVNSRVAEAEKAAKGMLESLLKAETPRQELPHKPPAKQA